MDQGVHGLLLEDLIIFRTLTTHAFNHGLVNTDWGHMDVFLWRLLTKNETKIKMEELSVITDHEVLEMAVTKSKKVSGSSVCRIRKQIIRFDLFQRYSGILSFAR
jgi:hypothetical protein